MGLRSMFGFQTKAEKEEEKAKVEKDLPQTGQEQKSATEEEKKEKEREWADVTEPVKFVCKGGKVECKYCSPSVVAEILPTSTQVMLQDKPYVTIGDKNGKANFNFTGICKHSSHGSKKPPCKAVINLGEWKDYSKTMIDDYNAILVKSKIPCMVSGEDLVITHSGQKAELSEVKPKVKREPQIIESYWINEDGDRIEKIAPNKNASLVIKTKDYKKKDKITVKLPIDGEEKEFVTHVNSKGIAILKNIFNYENKALKKEPRIIEAYWRNEKGEKISEIEVDEKAELFVRTEGYDKGENVTIELKRSDNKEFESKKTIKLKGKIKENGIAVVKNSNWS